MNGTTTAILSRVRALGYIVKIFRINSTVEIHAVPLDGDNAPQVARCNDGDGPDEEYRAACMLAEGVGIDLKHG